VPVPKTDYNRIFMKIFLGISSFQLLTMFRRGLFYTYLTIYLRHFLGLSVTATTLFATLPMILNVAAQRYVWGILSDRYQKRRSLIIWGEILGGAGTIILWYAHRLAGTKIMSGWVIIAGLCIIEIFWSMSNIGWSALISDLYQQHDRGKIMGKLESIGGMGRMAGVLAGGLFYDRMGTAFAGWGFYQGILFFISAGAMFLSVFPMFMVPEGGINKQHSPAATPKDPDYSSGIFMMFIAAMTLIHFGRNSVAVTMAQYLILDPGPHLSSLVLSHVVNLRSAGIVLAGLVTGLLLNMTGKRMLLAAGSLAAIVSLLILGIADSMTWICTSSFLMGVSEVLILAASYELASSYIPPSRRARLFSIFNATLFLSWGTAGTLIAGPITDFMIYLGKTQAHAYKISFLAASIITAAGFGLLFLLFSMEKKEQAPF
jgi:MFS family permease